jgi:folate-dependent phosphoribosylglycinamide formyltransferase PurN
MVKSPIYISKKGIKMKVACFVSGSGTNARRIIEHSKSDVSGFEVELIFTDVRDDRVRKNGEKMCKAKDITDEYDLAYECEDIRDFYYSKGHKNRRDLSLRPEFDSRVVRKIAPYKIDVIALAGYMSITTEPILSEYKGRMLNVHPADLSIMDGTERKFVGIHVVRDAILAGEKELRATTHIVREKVDYGEILLISKPVLVRLPRGIDIELLKEDKKTLMKIVDNHQNKLKEKGDWVIYPLTLQMISEGSFALDGKGNVFLDGEKLNKGYRL